MLSDERIQEILAEKSGCRVTPNLLAGVKAVAEAAVKDAVGGEVVGRLRMGAEQTFRTTPEASELASDVWHDLYTSPQASAAVMPQLTDAMRAVIRNESTVYGSEDELYAALCQAASLEASATVPNTGLLMECALFAARIGLVAGTSNWAHCMQQQLGASQPAVKSCGNCHKCLKGVTENGWPVTSQRMIICSACHNKRCPKASDHELECTGSNEPGQPGSIFGQPEAKS